MIFTIRKRWLKGLLGLYTVAALMMPNTVLAHALGENYVFLNFREASIDGRFEFNFVDLKDKLGIDLEAEATERTEAIEATAQRVQAYIEANFSIGEVGQSPYTLIFTDLTFLSPTTKFAQYHFRADTGPLPDQLQIRHEMCYEDDRFHRALVLVNHNSIAKCSRLALTSTNRTPPWPWYNGPRPRC